MKNNQQQSPKRNPTTPKAASRMQSGVAKDNGGTVPKGNYVGRIQKAAKNNFGKPGGK